MTFWGQFDLRRTLVLIAFSRGWCVLRITLRITLLIHWFLLHLKFQDTMLGIV
jgi:hypothetical protein